MSPSPDAIRHVALIGLGWHARRVYYPALRKYFVMEDDCAQCITDWRSSRTPHIDLWTGDYQGSALLACENALTPDGRVAVEVNPPPGRPVDPRPLFNGRGCTT